MIVIKVEPVPAEGFSAYGVSENGRVVNIRTGKVLKGARKKSGYLMVTLHGDCGEKRDFLVHRLVALAFVPRPDSLEPLEVNHINGDKMDNDASNLEWISHNENLKHAYEAGLREDDVSARRVRATNIVTGESMVFPSIYKAARFLRISQGNICMCCKGIRPYASGYFWEYEEGGAAQVYGNGNGEE